MRVQPVKDLCRKAEDQAAAFWAKVCDLSDKHLNFYRTHLIFFCVTPCIAAGIFYGSNGTIYITYTDALFMCVSAITVTGLNSTPLADLTGWQQVILFILMAIGSTCSVSIVTILIRKHFFRKRFEHLVKTNMEARKKCVDVEKKDAALPSHNPRRMINRLLHRGPSAKAGLRSKKKKRQKLDVSMVRRTDEPGRPIHTQADEGPEVIGPSSASETSDESAKKVANITPDIDAIERSADPEKAGYTGLNEMGEAGAALPEIKHLTISDHAPPARARRSSEPGIDVHSHDRRFRKALTIDPVGTHATGVPRTRTIEFADRTSHGDLRRRALTHQNSRAQHFRPASETIRSPGIASESQSFPRVSTMSGERPKKRSYKSKGYGGFPNPIEFGLRALGRRAEPVLNRVATVHRTPTMRAPTSGSLGMTRTGTIYSAYGDDGDGRAVNYISFDAIVGRNSTFHKLTTAQEEELGGVEYRALDVLLYILIFYYLGIQLISVAMIAPYLSTSRFDDIFVENPDRLNPTQSSVSATWFTFFNVWSAFSNNGMCLIDASLTVFQSTYFLLFVTIFNIFAGNTALPVFLRFFIWTLSKMVPNQSRLRETLQFLLDHPRRCYIYLFPAYQTWFLLFVLIALNCTDWIAFLVLDINNPVLDQIPIGTRIVDGLQQAAAVRAAGFQVVNLQAVAPALQVLYVIMMYIAVYPIALSIRSTNVYESKSLGLYDEEDDEEEMDAHFEKVAHAGTYIAYHARKQLAFDIWWLVAALWVICIIERDAIADPATDTWFNEFTVIFEIASAYGTVGLSLGRGDGSPTSLSGVFRNLAKIVMCAVMLRGRHRGLPNAIDRAVLLPSDLNDLKTETFGSTDAERMAMRARTRRASMRFGSMSETPVPPVRSDPADDADGWINDDSEIKGLSPIAASTDPSTAVSPISTMAAQDFGSSSKRPLLERSQFSDEPEECTPEMREKGRGEERAITLTECGGMRRGPDHVCNVTDAL